MVESYESRSPSQKSNPLIMVTITLKGSLGAAVGRSCWKLHVNSVAEGVRAVEAQTGQLYAHLRAKEQEGIEYRVVINGKDHRGTEDLITPSNRLRSIEIVPVPSGSGNGTLQLILGIVLIIIGVVLFAFGGGVIASLGVSIALAGISTTLGGIAQMLAKSPKLDNTKSAEFTPNASYLFTSITNTARQGNVVPLGYGRMIVGSQLVSFGLHAYSIGPVGYLPIPAQVGTTTVPAYLSLSFWARNYPYGFTNDPRRNYVMTDWQIDSYPVQSLYDAADVFSLRSNGHSAADFVDLRAMLKVISRLIKFHSSLTFLQAKGLYNWLGLTGVAANGVQIIDYIRALTDFYLPLANTND